MTTRLTDYTFTGDWTGAYVAPASTEFQFSTLVEGGVFLLRSYGVFRPYNLGPMSGGLHLHLSPSVLIMRDMCNYRQGRILVYYPLVGRLITRRQMIPLLVGRASAGKQIINKLVYTPPPEGMVHGGWGSYEDYPG